MAEVTNRDDIPMDDAAAMGLEDTAPAAEAPTKVRMQYVGLPPYGTEFLTEHSFGKDDVRNSLLRTGMDEDDVKEAVRGVKTVVFHRDRGFTAEVTDLPPEMLEILENDPAWKTVK